MPLLEVKSLEAFYGDFQALFGIDIAVEAGEVVAIIGSNGAGKSTLLGCITGLLRTKSGSIRFDGTEIIEQRANLISRRGIALVPEGRRLFASLSVQENLQMGLVAGRSGHWTLPRIYALFPMLYDLRGRPAMHPRDRCRPPKQRARRQAETRRNAMSARFEGRTVLVTGAGRGIGRATALAFAAEGARLVVADALEQEGAATADLRHQRGSEAVFIRTDVSRDADCAAMVAAALQHFGRLDIAFNNAGVGGTGFNLDEEDEAAFDRQIAVNLKGVFLSMRHEIRAMKASGGGAIVNTASVGGLIANPGLTAYCASKHGVVGLTKGAALELATSGIRVNAICPAATRTAMLEAWFQDPEVEKHVMGLTPMRRIAAPEEMAGMVLFLASDAASFMTGAAVPVDGGLVAQ